MFKTPIFWLQLRHQPMQTISATIGIAFITVFLFVQIGFRLSFLDTFVKLPKHLNADLFIVHSSLTTILRPASFSHYRLYQALAFDDVVSVAPVYTTIIQMPDPAGTPNFIQGVQVVGLPLNRNILDIPDVMANENILSRRGTFLIDSKSRAEFRPAIESVKSNGLYLTEIRLDKKQTAIRIEALFSMGSNAATNAYLITSDLTFMDVLDRDRSQIDIGLVSLRAGADPESVAKRLSSYLPKDVMVLTKKRAIKAEQDFYEFGTPAGIMFRFGLGRCRLSRDCHFVPNLISAHIGICQKLCDFKSYWF